MKGRKIILGVTAGIAAYKAAFLVRLLVKAGADVRVIMTPSAKEFITPLTLSTLSRNPVLSRFVRNKKGEWNNHVELGMWADLMLIAPASANTISKMATGTCDNLLMAVYLSSRCPVMIAPAMDLDMFQHATTRKNLSQLKKDGVIIIPPGKGELASGLSGEGRMEEPENILAHIEKYFAYSLPLHGKRALVTAGPTYEAIDPVRFIGNHSSGKMGFAIANELARQGADVTLITGPSSQLIGLDSIKRINVTTAAEMFDVCMKHSVKQDIIIKSAAVADYRPVKPSKSKIKKSAQVPLLVLEKTKDILSELGRRKKKRQVLIGFALESDDGVVSAKRKLKEKNLDAIVLNSLRDGGAGFGGDMNKITLFTRDNKTIKFELQSKEKVARDIVAWLIKKQ